MAGDSNFSSVSLLLPFDGPNGGTTFNDRSLNKKIVTAYGGTSISTSQSKFNGSSAYFDGVNDNLEINPTGWYLSSSDSSSALGAVDFTIECWVYIDGTTYNYYVYTLGAPGSGTGTTPSYRQGLRCEVTNTALAIAAGNLNTDGASGYMYRTAAVSLTTGWHHVAFQSTSNTPSIYLNGVLQTLNNGGVGTATSFSATKLYCPRVVQVQSAGVYGGALDATLTGTAVFKRGYIDDLRITKGVVRYTANFDVPTEPNPIGFGTNTGEIAVSGQTPAWSVPVLLTPAQKAISLTGQTPELPTSFTGTVTQRSITISGQTPSLPSPFAGTAIQRGITLAGQAPTADIRQVDTGVLTGTGFSTIPAISWVVDDTATVSGTGFVSAQVILGGATVLGSSFSSALTATYATDNTAYVTGSAFITTPIISTTSNAVIGVTGRGFRTTPELLGSAKVQGVGFKTTLSAIADVPSSASIVGSVFSTAPTIEAVAISSAIIIGGSFVSGLAYSKITGRSFSSRPIIKTAFTAEYAEAYVMNVLTGAVSRYENYPFMSLARIGGSYYGLAADGLYELTGESDLEDDVLGTIRTNDEDLDAFNSRNIPYMYLNGEDDYSVTAVVDEVAQPTFTSGFGGRRVRLARGSKGRYWCFEIGGIKHLQGLEYTPDRLTRKVK